MWQSLLLHFIVVVNAYIDEISDNPLNNIKSNEAHPIFIEINSDLLRPKNVIKFDTEKQRLKRSNSFNNASLSLQITPGFFSNSKLKNLYEAITGSRMGRDIGIKCNKKITSTDDTKLVFQINPIMSPRINLKRDVEEFSRGENIASFALKLNPVVPRRMGNVRRFNDSCVDRPVNQLWCRCHKEFAKCSVTEPTIPTTTMCLPTQPKVTEINRHLGHMCRIDWRQHRHSPFPCDIVPPFVCSPFTTPYIPCKSSPPPTAKPSISCTDKTRPCINFPRTSCPTQRVNTNSLITQKCANTQARPNRNAYLFKEKPNKYFILFKRSSPFFWPIYGRKKRERPNKKRKYFLRLVSNIG